MKNHTHLLLLLILCLSAACLSAPPAFVDPTSTPGRITPEVTLTSSRTCMPTLNDGVSPSYKPDSPERTVVGKGHVLTGVVLSSMDCTPIVHAKLEFWPEEEGLGHPDSSRATLYTDDKGRYSFESNPPEHIHMRVSASGYRTIGINSYHPQGQALGVFDIVLEPE